MVPLRCVVYNPGSWATQLFQSTAESSSCSVCIGSCQTELAFYNHEIHSLGTKVSFFSSLSSCKSRWTVNHRFCSVFVALDLNSSWCWTCKRCWAPALIIVIILKMFRWSQISLLDVDSDAYQKMNRSLIYAGFRKWDNRVRLVMDALPLFCSFCR